MSKNYAALAQQIITAIGGVDNVAAVTHCMTRLRFVVKDSEQVDSTILKGLKGVLGVVRSDNQCQVIIGNTVSQAYREVVALLPGDLRPAEPQGKPPVTLKRIGAGILDALIGTMSPLIPAIIGGSMVKLLAMILEMTGVLPKRRANADHSDGDRRWRVLLPAADGSSFRGGEIQNQYVAGDCHCRGAGASELYRADGESRPGRAR